MLFDRIQLPDWLGALGTVVSSLIAWNAYVLTKRIEEEKKPAIQASGIAHGTKIDNERMSLTVELNIVNPSKARFWISEMDWRDSSDHAREILSREFSALNFPFHIDSGELKKFKWNVEIRHSDELCGEFSGNLADPQLFAASVIDDFQKWSLVVHTTTMKPEFVYIKNVDYYSVKAWPRYCEEAMAHYEENQKWIGLKNYPLYLWRTLKYWRLPRAVEKAKVLWYGSGTER